MCWVFVREWAFSSIHFQKQFVIGGKPQANCEEKARNDRQIKKDPYQREGFIDKADVEHRSVATNKKIPNKNPKTPVMLRKRPLGRGGALRVSRVHRCSSTESQLLRAGRSTLNWRCVRAASDTEERQKLRPVYSTCQRRVVRQVCSRSRRPIRLTDKLQLVANYAKILCPGQHPQNRRNDDHDRGQ